MIMNQMILEEDSDDDEGGFVSPIGELSPKEKKEDSKNQRNMYNLNLQILTGNLMLARHLRHYFRKRKTLNFPT